MAKRPTKMGRPSKPPTPGARISLGLKVTPKVKERVDRARQESGRTQSQEAEFLLEKALERESLLPQVLELTYGRQLAGILLFIGAAMRTEGQNAARYPFGEQWLSDPRAFEQAVRTAHELLLRMAPPKEPSLVPVEPEELTQGNQTFVKFAQEQRDKADKQREEDRRARVEQAIQILASGMIRNGRKLRQRANFSGQSSSA